MAISKPKTMGTKLPPAPPPGPSLAVQPVALPAKKFSVKSWSGQGEGEKIMLYGDTGIGKSSLAILSPDPVFIGLDDGARKLRHPATGEPVKCIAGVETFADVLSVLGQRDVFEGFKTVVVDTVTILQDWAEPYVFQTIPGPKDIRITNLESYGYNKGYKHLYDTMKLILVACDGLVRVGKNIIFVAQSFPSRIANPGGEDFLREGPRLHVDKTWSIESLYCEWCDHILRVNYFNSFVAKDKKITGDTQRAVYVQPEVYFRAKSRTIKEAVVSFETSADPSIWKFVFGDENE